MVDKFVDLHDVKQVLELHKPAARSVLAHLVKLVREGRVVCNKPEPAITATFRLA